MDVRQVDRAASRSAAQHARWDIIHFANGAPPGPISPGGAASAEAANGGGTITLTGSGTFVAPAGGGSSHSVTGGGTWTTSSDGRSGTYRVVELVDFEFANLQVPPPVLIDNIGDEHIKKLNLLMDCSSSIPAIPNVVDFPALTQAWLKQMAKRGLVLTDSVSFWS